ncbi:MAG: efflux transporter outer membrane subunit [Limisphaerales bacterium]
MKRILQYFALGPTLLVIVIAGCKAGPNYKRPSTNTPAAFRRAASDTSRTVGTNSFADLCWWNVYEDPQLKAYLTEALTNSWDIKIAAARVLQAEATARITHSRYFPDVNLGGDILNTRISQRGGDFPLGIKPQSTFGEVFVFSPSYEVDLWGRVRRANEAALARLLSAEWAQNTVRQTLVADVATTYLQLLALDLDLEIARASYVSRTNSLDLTVSRQQGGVAAMQDVYQSQVLVFTTEASIADTLRRIEQTENALNILMGRNPGSIKRGISLVQQPLRASVPPGLPSSLLERRPDIRSAEENLVAANADIGQAKAAYFPRLTLTGTYGFQSVSLASLFAQPSQTWQFGPTVTFPFFTGGRLQAEVKLAKGRFEESLAIYQRTVQNAFREVSDGLIAYQRTQEFYAKQLELTEANRAATELAHVRYEGGVTSYLEVLYNEQQLFDAEFRLAAARRDELLSVVQLYQALGGGWAGSYAANPSAKHSPSTN